MVILKLVQSMTKMILSPPAIFNEQILHHFYEKGKNMYLRIKSYMDLSDPEVLSGTKSDPEIRITINNEVVVESTSSEPEFPLVPASRGFCLTLIGLLENFHKTLQAIRE